MKNELGFQSYSVIGALGARQSDIGALAVYNPARCRALRLECVPSNCLKLVCGAGAAGAGTFRAEPEPPEHFVRSRSRLNKFWLRLRKREK